MDTGRRIRELTPSEMGPALALVWEVFLEFEAPDYPQQGVDEFRRFLADEGELRKLRFFGIWEQERLAGILAMRHAHISLFFVRKEFHKQGMGRALFQFVLEQTGYRRVTVNSSPYAQEFYRKLGFIPTAAEQITNGIRFIPMVSERI